MYSIEWKHSRRSDVTANTRKRRRRTGLTEGETRETRETRETDRQRVIRLQ